MGRTGVAIGLLGPLEVTIDGTPVDIPRGRVRALLAVLALSPGREVPAGMLAERIWDDDLPANVRGSLHTAVMRLRRVLGADRVVTTADGYLLDVPADAVDAVRFTELLDGAEAVGGRPGQLREALVLWRGMPFEPAYSDWLARVERPVLVERRLDATERLADLEIAAGRAGEAVAALRELVQLHPLRESLWARLLAALEGAGRPAEALAAYETVRVEVARELGVTPGAELQRLHADLLAGTAPAVDTTVARRLSAVPVQLPADIDDFAGRGQALRTLDEQLLRRPAGGSTLIAIHGAGGVGKTALAVHWARRVRDEFRDGQLYLDLRGYGPGEPMEPAAALDVLLRGLGVPAERVPAGVDARSAQWRTTLSGRQVLVLLDNARDAAQVRQLLPAAGTVVIVTSRSQLRGLAARERAHRIGLDVLPAEDAAAFLAHRLKDLEVASTAESLARLAELCGYLPLALTVAAERAGRHPDSPLTELIDQLGDERSRLDVLETGGDLTTSLRAVMSWSYRALDAAAARVFRLLGLHPGTDIAAPATAALAGLDRPVAARLLDRLAETHLLRSPRPGRYAMHDLVRTYAAERLGSEQPAVRDDAVRRLVGWYARSATSASVAVWGNQAADPPGPGEDALRFADDRQAMTWFGAEQQNLLAVTALAVRLDRRDEVVQLVRAVSIYLDLSRAPIEIEPLQQQALGAARAVGDKRAEAQLLIQLGRFRERRGEYARALPCFESALDLHHHLGDVIGECAALGNLGITHRRLGQHAESVEFLERSIALARRHELHDRAAAGLNSLAVVYQEVGRHAAAVAAATESVRLWRGVGLALREGIAIDSLATIYLAGGDQARAITCYRQALETFRGLGGGWWLAYTLRNAGQGQLAAGDDAGARQSWLEALRIMDEIGAEDNAELARDELRDLLGDLSDTRAEDGWVTQF